MNCRRSLITSHSATTHLLNSRANCRKSIFDKALSRSAKGYITFNDIAPPEFRPMTRDELCQRLDARVLPAKNLLTHPNNCIIVWGAAVTRSSP